MNRERELLIIVGVGLVGLIVFVLVLTGYLLTHE